MNYNTHKYQLKTKHLNSVFWAIAIAALFTSLFDQSLTGQPDGISGFSGAKSSCNTCHYGVQVNTINNENTILTSDIPLSGYIPGTTYNFTLLVKTQKPKLGFDLRSQNENGVLVGNSNNVTNGRILNGEVVHNSNNTVSGNNKTVTFKWIAPASGTGDVTFWGSVAINPVGTQSMDTLNKFMVSFKEDPTIGIVDDNFSNERFSVNSTLNPEQFELKLNLRTNSNVEIGLYDIQGHFVRELMTEQNVSPRLLTQVIDCSSLNKGIYLILIRVDNTLSVRRIYNI